MISRKESEEWIERAVEVVRALGGKVSPCATMFCPNRYSLLTQYGEVKIDIDNVFEYWMVGLMFPNPKHVPAGVSYYYGNHSWQRLQSVGMEVALKELEVELRSWIG